MAMIVESRSRYGTLKISCYPPMLRVFTARFSLYMKGLVCLLLLLAACPSYANAIPNLGFAGLARTINTGGSITLGSPSGIVVDPAGDIFIADTVSGSGRIVEVNAQGTASVLTVSGLSPALGSLAGIAIDGAGNLYVVDTGNTRVVKITSSGAGSVISTGSVILTSPQGVALDQAGDIFISDGTSTSSQIVEVASGGSAAALSITVSSGLSTPKGLAVDVSGNLYIADSVHSRIVKVAAGSTTGVVVSISGITLTSPSDVAVDGVGNLFITDNSDGGSRIAEVDTSGNGFVLPISPFTLSNGAAGVALDVFGTVYIADTGNSRSLIVDPALDMNSSDTNGYSSSLNRSAVGFGHVQLGADSSGTVTLSLPFFIGLGPGGNQKTLGATAVKVFTSGTENLDFTLGTGTTCVATTTNNSCTVEIHFLPTAPGLRTGAVVLYDNSTPQVPILTLPLYGFSDAPVAALAPNIGTVIGTGGVVLSFPFQLAVDGAGNIYDANDGGNLVKITAGGSASVVTPGSLTFGNEVTGAVLDGAGNLFISDHTNSRIIVLTPGGSASVLAISGLGATGLNHPTALAFDGAGNLYISDWTNGRVVEVSSLKVLGLTSSGIGTVIGTGSYTIGSDAVTGVAVDWMGNIYIPDGYNGTDPSRIIKVTSAGVVSLLTPTGITFSRPRGVSVDGMGNIYVADGGNNRIVKITTAGIASVLAVSGLPTPAALGSPFGVTVDPSGNLYLPDSGNNRVVFVNVSGAALSFPSTAKGATSAAKTATVTNLGNQPLIFSTNPTYTADFSNNSGDTNPCTSSTSLSSGMLCDVSVVFTPQTVASLSAGITVTNNTLNVAGSTQQVSVSGTSFSQGDTTSTTVAMTPTSLVRGQPATLTATVADTTSGHTTTIPTGSVTFTDMVGSTITTLNNGSSVSLSGGRATLPGVVLSGIGTHTINVNYAGVSGIYLASSSTSPAMATLSKASVTVTGPTTQPVAVTVGQTASAAVTVTAPYTTIAAPSGTISYSILNSSSTSVASGTLALTAGTGSSTATVPIPSTLAAGSYTISITYSGDSNYLLTSTATTIQVQISQLTPTISWSPAATTISYGATLSGILNASALNGTSSVPGSFVYTASLSGGSASTVTSATVLGAGSYTLTATFTPSDATTYKSVSSTLVLVVGKQSPTTGLISSINPVLTTSPVTFTATVSVAAGTPTGSVSFYDGATLLGAVTLSQKVAAFTTSSLTVGPHSITAIYSGDSNFATITSAAIAQVVQDFSVTSGGGSGGSGGGSGGSGGGGSSNTPTQTVLPGETATYPVALGLTTGTTLPVPVVLTVTGAPPGATATLTPQSFPAGTPFTPVTLSVVLPTTTASLRQEDPLSRRFVPMLLGMLLLPFAWRMRRSAARLRNIACALLVALACLGCVLGLSACGSKTSGYFAQQQKTYTLTITATAGTVSRNTYVTLTVQ